MLRKKVYGIITFNYKKYELNSRQFFPFYDYDNILEAEKIKKVYYPKINIEKELIECYNWYREHKEYIKYRNYVETEKNILNMMKKI